MYKKLTMPLEEEIIQSLRAGDRVLISGTIYAARDAAHRCMVDALNAGEKLPVDLAGQMIYYAGPCPPKPGYAAGPFGPTTSGRMDKYAVDIMEQGLKAMMGKGDRADFVIDAMIAHKCVYLAAIGGLGAYTSTKISALRVMAYEDLGAEALMEIEVEDFPAIVAIDCDGNNLYRIEPDKYKNKFDIKIFDR